MFDFQSVSRQIIIESFQSAFTVATQEELMLVLNVW